MCIRDSHKAVSYSRNRDGAAYSLEEKPLSHSVPALSLIHILLFFKLFLKLFKTTFLGKPALQVGKVRHGTAEALHLIEMCIRDRVFIVKPLGS